MAVVSNITGASVNSKPDGVWPSLTSQGKGGPPQYNKRRTRTLFSSQSLSILEEVFEGSPYPDVTVREGLAEQLGVAEARVHTWFQNRRSRLNKSTKAKRGGGCVDRTPRPRTRAPRKASRPQPSRDLSPASSDDGVTETWGSQDKPKPVTSLKRPWCDDLNGTLPPKRHTIDLKRNIEEVTSTPAKEIQPLDLSMRSVRPRNGPYRPAPLSLGASRLPYNSPMLPVMSPISPWYYSPYSSDIYPLSPDASLALSSTPANRDGSFFQFAPQRIPVAAPGSLPSVYGSSPGIIRVTHMSPGADSSGYMSQLSLSASP